MARQIRDLKDKKSKVKFFPKTHVKAVVDDHGNKLDAILDNKVGTDSEVSTAGEFVYAKDENGKSVLIAKDSIAKIIAEEIAKIPNALAAVNFGATTMPELSAAVGTKLYGATDASGLASVVAQQINPLTHNMTNLTGGYDIDTVRTEGIYNCQGVSNSPAGGTTAYGTLEVRVSRLGNYPYITQFYIIPNANPSEVYVRNTINQGAGWSSWSRMDNFGAKNAADLASVVAGQLKYYNYFGSVNNTPRKTGIPYPLSNRFVSIDVGANDSTQKCVCLFFFNFYGNPVKIMDNSPYSFIITKDTDGYYLSCEQNATSSASISVVL